MKECTKVVYELMNESSITFNNIDMKIAKKLLWFVSTEADRRERGINHLVSRRVTNRGRTPGLTGFFDEEEGTWQHVTTPVSEAEERKILATVVAGLVRES